MATVQTEPLSVLYEKDGAHGARRGSPDPAASPHRRSPVPAEDTHVSHVHHRTALSSTSFSIFPPDAQQLADENRQCSLLSPIPCARDCGADSRSSPARSPPS